MEDMWINGRGLFVFAVGIAECGASSRAKNGSDSAGTSSSGIRGTEPIAASFNISLRSKVYPALLFLTDCVGESVGKW